MNEKFAICTKPRYIHVTKSAPVNFSVRAKRLGFVLGLIGSVINVTTELEMWEAINKFVGPTAWSSMEQFSIINAGIAHRGQIMLMGGELLLEDKVTALKEEMRSIFQCFIDSQGLRLVSKGISVNQPSYSRNISMNHVRGKVVLPYIEGKTEIVMEMLPDPIDPNGWHIVVKMPEGTEYQYRQNRELVRNGLSAISMEKGITLIDINQGASIYW